MDGECLGRSRGGLSTKLHLAVDGRGLPLSVIITSGQDGDNPQLLPLLDQIRVPRQGPGRRRSRPEAVLADKAYSPYPHAPHCENGVFASPVLSEAIRSPVAKPKARAVADHPGGPGRVQAAQHRRAMLQPTQTVPRLRHPLRQTRRLLPRRDHHRRHHPLAPMTYRTGPSRIRTIRPESSFGWLAPPQPTCALESQPSAICLPGIRRCGRHGIVRSNRSAAERDISPSMQVIRPGRLSINVDPMLHPYESDQLRDFARVALA